MPYEDYIIHDEDNSVFIVMDGISRKKEEVNKNGFSMAANVAEIFAKEMHKFILEHKTMMDCFDHISMVLCEGFNRANKAVKDMLDANVKYYQGFELPGAVGIVAVIVGRMLVYGSLGDCMGVLVRNKQKIIFSQKQTTFAFDIIGVEKDRELLMKEYVNNKESEYGYGVVNGQADAVKYFNISYVNLDKKDVIYLASDGVSDLIQYGKIETFINKSLKEIIEMSNEQDLMIGKPYFDDKSIIKISIEN